MLRIRYVLDIQPRGQIGAPHDRDIGVGARLPMQKQRGIGVGRRPRVGHDEKADIRHPENGRVLLLRARAASALWVAFDELVERIGTEFDARRRAVRRRFRRGGQPIPRPFRAIAIDGVGLVALGDFRRRSDDRASRFAASACPVETAETLARAASGAICVIIASKS